MKIEKLLPESLIAAYRPYDYMDSYAKKVSCQTPITADLFFEKAFQRQSSWSKQLLHLRNQLVKPLKLDGVGRLSDLICAQTPDEIVFGKEDKHLTFYTSLRRGRWFNGRQELRITTVVQYHCTLGKIYFLIIRPFHIVIVNTLLKRVAKSL